MKNLITVLVLAFSSICLASTVGEASRAAERGDFRTALDILTPLAEAGDVDALGNIGNMYAFGRGVDKDIKKAYAYWSRAADKHLGSAMYNIATIHATGEGGFEKDLALAASWYRRAAEHRHFRAMVTISSLYALGQGVQQDKIQALAWAGLAASNAPSQEHRQATVGQARKIAEGMSKEEVAQAQVISNELLKVIDANVRQYKAP